MRDFSHPRRPHTGNCCSAALAFTTPWSIRMISSSAILRIGTFFISPVVHYPSATYLSHSLSTFTVKFLDSHRKLWLHCLTVYRIFTEISYTSAVDIQLSWCITTPYPYSKLLMLTWLYTQMVILWYNLPFYGKTIFINTLPMQQTKSDTTYQLIDLIRIAMFIR